jgi:hypothetical protein
MVAQRFRVIRIETQHALERVHGVGLAGKIDEDLSQGDEGGKVIHIASDEGDNSGQGTSRPASAPVRPHELDDRSVVVRRRYENSLELPDRARVVSGFGKKSSERDTSLNLALIYGQARAISGYRFARISKRRVQIADAFHDIRVPGFASPERNENFARSGIVERSNTRLGGEEQQVDVGAPGLDQGFRVRPRFFGAAKRQQRSRSSLTRIAIRLVQPECAAISLEGFSVETLRREAIAGEHKSNDLVASAREHPRDLCLGAIVHTLSDEIPGEREPRHWVFAGWLSTARRLLGE